MFENLELEMSKGTMLVIRPSGDLVTVILARLEATEKHFFWGNNTDNPSSYLSGQTLASTLQVTEYTLRKRWPRWLEKLLHRKPAPLREDLHRALAAIEKLVRSDRLITITKSESEFTLSLFDIENPEEKPLQIEASTLALTFYLLAIKIH